MLTVVRGDILALFLIWDEKLVSFLPLSIIITVGCLQMFFHQVDEVPLDTLFAESFSFFLIMNKY